MRIRDPWAEQEEPYNLVPLTDMVFNLLIFFMAATTFAQIEKDMQVRLPRTGQVQALSAPPQQLVINIKEDGAMVVSGRAYDVQAVSEMLRRVAKENPNRNVLIRADERSIHRYFAAVVRMCREAGINEVKIGYLLDGPKS